VFKRCSKFSGEEVLRFYLNLMLNKMYSVDSFSSGHTFITSYICAVGMYGYRGRTIVKASYAGLQTFFRCCPCEIFCGHCDAGTGFGL
jgi:hypothetical protein